MKIAHLISSKVFAGIEQHVYELASKMADISEQVIICDADIHEQMKDVQTVSLNIGSRYSPLNTYKLIKNLNHLVEPLLKPPHVALTLWVGIGVG